MCLMKLMCAQILLNMQHSVSVTDSDLLKVDRALTVPTCVRPVLPALAPPSPNPNTTSPRDNREYTDSHKVTHTVEPLADHGLSGDWASTRGNGSQTGGLSDRRSPLGDLL